MYMGKVGKVKDRDGIFYKILIISCSFLFSLITEHQSVVVSKPPTVRIQCMSGFMVITIKDAPSTDEGFFSGMIYPKELSKNSTCMSEFHNHEGQLKYKLPLRSCSTMPQETVSFDRHDIYGG